MEPERISKVPGQGCVIDLATLYLCRHGQQWVVVIESPRLTAAVPLGPSARDSYDARFELLERARRACPGAAIDTTDGAVDGADYEWRLEVRGVHGHEGGLGEALHRELATRPLQHRRRLSTMRATRHCQHGWCPAASGRPRVF